MVSLLHGTIMKKQVKQENCFGCYASDLRMVVMPHSVIIDAFCNTCCIVIKSTHFAIPAAFCDRIETFIIKKLPLFITKFCRVF